MTGANPQGGPSRAAAADDAQSEHDRLGPLTDDDLYLFNEGTHRKLARKLGAHLGAGGGASFAVWAPNATGVAVIGDFNDWDRAADPLAPRGVSGIWQGRLADAKPGTYTSSP